MGEARMILALTTTYLALARHQAPIDDAGRLAAVQSIVNFAKEVEAVCHPHFRTDPPTIIRVIPTLPLPAWAEATKSGGFYISYNNLGGFVEGERIKVLFRSRQKPPKNSLLWGADECLANARAVAELVKPAGFILGESVVNNPGEFSFHVRTKVVLPQDSRLVATLIDLEIDARTGLPKSVEKGGYRPLIALERLRGIRPLRDLIAEAASIHRSLPPLGAARLTWSTLVYKVPAFSSTRLNEMTPEHRVYEARKEAIPMYEWVLVSGEGTATAKNRIVWIDARTGRGIAVSDLALPVAGGASTAKPVSHPDSGRWRVSKAEGAFVKTEPAQFEGIPTVVTNAKGEVLNLRFDPKSGRVRDDAGTYRPDAALLKAMRTQEPPRPFGKR